MCELPDIAWHDPALLLRGQLPSQLSGQKNPGKRVTNNLAASQHKMLEESQVDTRAETSIALPTMVSLGSRASFRGRASSFIAMVSQKPVELRQTVTSATLAYEKSFQETATELATNSFKAVSSELVPYQLACFIAAWQSLILHSLCVSAYLTYTLTAAKSFESLQQKELAAAYAFMAQFQDSPTRARQLQLSTAQLCRQQSTEESLQQKELAAAYCLMAQSDSPTRAHQLQLSTAQLCFANSVWLKASKPACSTRASQLIVDQLDAFRTGALQESGFQTGALQTAGSKAALETAGFSADASSIFAAAFCRSISSNFQAADPRTVVRKAAFQETGTAFQTGAFRSIPFKSAAFKTLVSAISSLNLHRVCLTSFQGEFQQFLQDPASAITTINAEKLPYPSRTTTSFSKKRVDELEETNNFAAMGQELAKYIANLREISQTFLPKNFRELEVIKDNFPQKPDIDACQVEFGNSELDIDACQVKLGHSEPDLDAGQVELGHSELDIDACQVELGNPKLDTGNFDQLTLKEPLGRRQPQQRQLLRQPLGRRDRLTGNFQDSSLAEETFRQATSQTAAWQKRPSDRQLPRQQLGRRDLQTGNFSDSSLAKTFRQATSQTAVWKKIPSERQLQRQQLGRRDLQKGNFRDSSLEEETFSKTTSQTAAWQKRASDRQLLRQQLGRRDLHKGNFRDSSLDEETFSTAASKKAAWTRHFALATLQRAAWQLSLEQPSFQTRTLRTEPLELQRRTSTTELSELERTALTTELSQLERTSFRQAALTKAALSLALRSPPSSLELTTAQLCFREASFGTLSGASFSTSRLRGGVLSGQLALSQPTLTLLSLTTTLWLKACPGESLQLVSLAELVTCRPCAVGASRRAPP